MSDSVVTAKKRGRPRTKPLAPAIPGKKRGRPKKSETMFKDAGLNVIRVHAPVFDKAMEDHSNPGNGFNYVYDRFFKDENTHGYFFYKEGMLFPTGIGLDPDVAVHKAMLEDWKFHNLNKIDSIILGADSSKIAAPVNDEAPVEPDPAA
jgi:hypothetical protein